MHMSQGYRPTPADRQPHHHLSDAQIDALIAAGRFELYEHPDGRFRTSREPVRAATMRVLRDLKLVTRHPTMRTWLPHLDDQRDFRVWHLTAGGLAILRTLGIQS